MPPLCIYGVCSARRLMRSTLLPVRSHHSDIGWNSHAVTCYHQTSAMYQSVLQRVSSMPELLDIIFDHLDPTSNVTNVVVCKGWSEVARDKLWREVHYPRRLLSILAPISVLTGVSSVAIMRIRWLIVLFRPSRGNSSRRTGPAL